MFSRLVRLLLSAVSFAGVAASSTAPAALLLAGLYLGGNVAIAIGSVFRGVRQFGRLELICLCLIGLSLIVWWVFDSPLLSLYISLATHLIGGIPTLKKVYQNPASESVAFWSLFFMSSLLSLLAGNWANINDMVFPLYITLFEGVMFGLALRRRT